MIKITHGSGVVARLKALASPAPKALGFDGATRPKFNSLGSNAAVRPKALGSYFFIYFLCQKNVGSQRRAGHLTSTKLKGISFLH
jgi:hypothetical protein